MWALSQAQILACTQWNLFHTTNNAHTQPLDVKTVYVPTYSVKKK